MLFVGKTFGLGVVVACIYSGPVPISLARLNVCPFSKPLESDLIPIGLEIWGYIISHDISKPFGLSLGELAVSESEEPNHCKNKQKDDFVGFHIVAK